MWPNKVIYDKGVVNAKWHLCLFKAGLFYISGFQLGQICPHRRHLAISGAMFIGYNLKVCVLCLCVWLGLGVVVLVASTGYGKHPTMHQTASLTAITLYLVQNASSAEVEKTCSGVLFFSYVRHFKNHFVFI